MGRGHCRLENDSWPPLSQKTRTGSPSTQNETYCFSGPKIRTGVLRRWETDMWVGWFPRGSPEDETGIRKRNSWYNSGTFFRPISHPCGTHPPRVSKMTIKVYVNRKFIYSFIVNEEMGEKTDTQKGGHKTVSRVDRNLHERWKSLNQVDNGPLEERDYPSSFQN